MKKWILMIMVIILVGCGGQTMDNKIVVFETSLGEFEVELYEKEAPISVENFLGYVSEGYYDGLIFHRVIDGFMIQGGGFNNKMEQKETKSPIKNEATNGLKNEKYTLAMARTGVVDSATSQFFVNVENNEFLNNRDTSTNGYGYAVFGKVVSGMEIVDKIKKVETGNVGQFSDVPTTTVYINKAYVKG